MLRITEVERRNGHVTLKLEGRIAEEWLGEVANACDRELSNGRRLTLDLADVEFAERPAVLLLRQLADRSVSLVNCSPFLTRQIERRNENGSPR